MRLPYPVLQILARLQQAGFSAYTVGGCVRDHLLGRVPHDWDVCTSALPEEMKTVFAGLRLVETGLKHGTLTILLDHTPIEVTTFRTDGVYSDHRRPDSVSFVTDLREDLARRDFTINAMAYAPETGVIDHFGGQDDLRFGLIRCVGNPEERFGEDALRILRALRFASVYSFQLEPQTARAAHALKDTLRYVAAERIRVELEKLLCGAGAGEILRAWPDVLSVIIPELAPMVGYDQNNHHHHFDLWEHTVRAVENVPPEVIYRVTMLLHDTGKPATRTTDEKGESHYRGHPDMSARIAEIVVDRLRFDRESQNRIVRLVRYHDIPLRNATGDIDISRRFLLRRLNKFGEEDLRALFRIHRADRIATGHSSPTREDQRLQRRMEALDALLAETPCFTLQDLAVKGNDLLALGLSGPALGQALHALLDAVMDGRVENDRQALLDYWQQLQTSGPD